MSAQIAVKPGLPLRPRAHTDYEPGRRTTPAITGVAQFLELVRTPAPAQTPQKLSYTHSQTMWERQKVNRRTRWKDALERLESARSAYNPRNDRNAAGDPYSTLFIGRLAYSIDERALAEELGKFGPIKHVHIVKDTKSNKPRGYAFVEYESSGAARSARREADNMLLSGRRIVAELERGRTQHSWLPRRLGGGRGGRHGVVEVRGREKREPPSQLHARGAKRGRPREYSSRSGFESRDRGDRDYNRPRGPPRDRDRDNSRYRPYPRRPESKPVPMDPSGRVLRQY